MKRREFITSLLASGTAVRLGLWGSLVSALSEEADAQIFTHSFWKAKSPGLYGAGANAHAELGKTSPTTITSFTLSKSGSWKRVSGGGSHAIAVGSDFKMWGVGDNSYGQLGLNNKINGTSWAAIAADKSWSQISCSDASTYGIDSAGAMWAWGSNSAGQLGANTAVAGRSSPVLVTGTLSWAQVAGGVDHVVGITSTGTLYAWGENSAGQLGIGTTTDKSSPVQIGVGTWLSAAAGFSFSVGVDSSGKLYGWGTGEYGQGSLLSATGAQHSSPVQIGAATGYTKVAAGFSHALALKSDGTLYGWGCNAFGGVGTGAAATGSPIQLSGTYTAIPDRINYLNFSLLTSTGAYGAGYNLYKPFKNSTTTSFPTLQSMASSSTWTKISCGTAFTVALDSTGKVYLEGVNPWTGATVASATAQTASGGPTSWSQISAGTSFFAAIGTDASLWGLGSGNSGQLGASSGSSTLVQISPGSWSQVSCGQTHLAAISTTGALYTIGNNSDGELGIGSSTQSFNTFSQAGTGYSWTQVACGDYSTFAIRTDGTLWGAGLGSNGQFMNSYSSVSSLTQIGSWTDWSKVSSGYLHVAGIRGDGSLWMWGGNGSGQLGVGTASQTNSPIQIAGSWTQVCAGYEMTAAMKADGSVWVWGGNAYGALGAGITPSSSPVQIAGSWTQITAGMFHSIGVKTDGTIWGWGSNYSGELGLGSTSFVTSPVQMTGTWSSVGPLAPTAMFTFLIK